MKELRHLKVIGYCRVSTNEQATVGVSLDAQEEKIRAYCTVKDWTLVEMVRDEGISAKNLNRPGLQSILSRISKKSKGRGFDGIVVVKLDRLTRSVGDLSRLNHIFEINHVDFISIQESVDTSTASGKLFYNVIAALSEWERDVISERTKDALKYKRSSGQLAGTLPYGYSLGDDGKTLHEDQEEQSTINMIRFLRGSNLSYSKIADTLNRKSIPTKRGKGRKWYAETVRSVLQHANVDP